MNIMLLLTSAQMGAERRLLRSLAVSLLVSILAASSALAQGQETPVPERARGAALVVVGRVETVQPRWHVNQYGDRLIVSSVRLSSVETLKGQPRSTVTVDVEGGSLDGVTLEVSDLPAFNPGDRAVFFLNQAGQQRLVPHLRGEGIMKLDQNDRAQETNLSLDEIRELVTEATR